MVPTDRPYADDTFRILGENIPGVVYLCNNDARYTMRYLNDAVRDLVGIPAAEFLADRVSFVELFHPDDAARIAPEVDAALAERRQYKLTYRLKHAAGHWVWVEEHGQGVFDEKGRLRFLEGTVFDITERVRAEEALRHSEQQYRGVFEAATDGMTILDPTGRVVEANPAVCHMHGYTREEFLRLAPHEIVHPDDLGLFQEFVTTVGGGRPFHCLARDVRKDGGTFDVEVHGTLIQYHGQPHLLGIVRDITDRKRAEAELQRAHDELEARVQARTAELAASEKRFRQLAENIQEVFWISTPDKGQMLYVSPAYETLFGRTCESLYKDPRSFLEAIHPADRQRVSDSLVLQTRGHYTVEFRIVRPGGQVRWVWTRAFPVLNEQGAVYRVAGISEDVTRRKRAEERSQAEGKLMRKLLDLQDRERKLIAYDIHDGLIQDVVGAQMHVAGARHLLESEHGVCVQSLELACELLTEAINDGRRLISELRPMVIDESGIAETINYLVQEEKRKGGLVIRFTNESHFGRLTPLLEGNLFRIVQEAINNVKRHSQADRADVHLRQLDGRLQLEIRDQGVGFDPATVPDDRFGLEGIRKRAELFGGRAIIESAPGAGTRIFVELPIVLAEE